MLRIESMKIRSTEAFYKYFEDRFIEAILPSNKNIDGGPSWCFKVTRDEFDEFGRSCGFMTDIPEEHRQVFKEKITKERGSLLNRLNRGALDDAYTGERFQIETRAYSERKTFSEKPNDPNTKAGFMVDKTTPTAIEYRVKLPEYVLQNQDLTSATGIQRYIINTLGRYNRTVTYIDSVEARNDVTVAFHKSREAAIEATAETIKKALEGMLKQCSQHAESILKFRNMSDSRVEISPPKVVSLPKK